MRPDLLRLPRKRLVVNQSNLLDLLGYLLLVEYCFLQLVNDAGQAVKDGEDKNNKEASRQNPEHEILFPWNFTVLPAKIFCGMQNCILGCIMYLFCL